MYGYKFLEIGIHRHSKILAPKLRFGCQNHLAYLREGAPVLDLEKITDAWPAVPGGQASNLTPAL